MNFLLKVFKKAWESFELVHDYISSSEADPGGCTRVYRYIEQGCGEHGKRWI